jgi:hypothetical protein
MLEQWVRVLCFVCVAWADPSPSLMPATPVDPATFATLRREDFAAVRAEVHAVFVEPPSAGRGMPDGVHPYPGYPPIATVEVRVAIHGKRVVLVLGSHASVHWKLEMPSSAQVEKVIAQGYYQQFVSGLPPGTTLLTYFSNPLTGVEGQYLLSAPSHLFGLFESVRRLTGARAASLQTEAPQRRVIIDGVSGVAPPGPETAFEPGRPVVLALTPMSGSRPAEELSVRFCCEKDAYTTAKATRAFFKGRIYFEATITLAANGAGEQTNVGLLSVPPSAAARLLAPPSHLGGHGFPLLDGSMRRSLRDQDLVGVAADLDAGRVFFHVNGNWAAGSPGSPGRGVAIRPGEEYVAAVSLTPDLRGQGVYGLEGWRLNFGASPFRFAVPDRYVAYATHPDGIEVFTSMRNNQWRRQQDDSRVAMGSRPHVGGQPGTTYAAGSSGAGAAAPDARAKAPEVVSISPQAEIHAVGVYEGGPGGVSLKITRSGPPVVLLLMAYDSVRWRLDVAPGVVLEKVVAMGYHAQRLESIPASVQTLSWSRANPDPRIFYYYGKSGGYDDFQQRVKAIFGREASSFQGAYRADQAVVDGRSRELAPQPKPVVLKCGRTTIVCGEGQDRVICGGREVLCR